ncbi:DUF2975 domain-containing protein [uncultured Algibacter sp.]|uniref:DUF2975 domain-containing protein n=1 Tax=uncultured Algibacter sp. TaxID=298659 RepID=UPI0026128050|nr:DUF2975 domain-containing protein [uncultured Algibacter sp.]
MNIAIIVCKFIRFFLVIVFIGLTTFFIHLQVDRSFYKGKEVSFNFKDYNYSSLRKWKVNPKSADKDVYVFGDIKTSSLYLNYVKYVAILIVLFLPFKAFQKIMTSVKEVKTFEQDTIKAFRKIGKYIFAYFLLTSYHSMTFKFGGYRGTSISLTPLLFVLLSFIMAEIFKEGRLLKKENDLTI